MTSLFTFDGGLASIVALSSIVVGLFVFLYAVYHYNSQGAE